MNMEEERIRFIPRENMTSVYNLSDVQNLPKTAYQHFMNNEDEVLYFLGMGGLEGVLSIGDLERFYANRKKKLNLNRKYTFCTSVDYGAAEDFFEQVQTINEIPVVEAGKFAGIIRKHKEKSLRDKQRWTLAKARIDRKWIVKMEIQRFVKETKACVFVYTYCATEAIKKEIEKANKIAGKGAKELLKCLSSDSDIEKEFCQMEYEEGLSDIMRAELEKIEIMVRDGIMMFSNTKGKCFRLESGDRITDNNPPEADRRILFIGPCIVFGQFCKNEHTIEAYVQEYLLENGYKEWKVQNKGRFGDYVLGELFTEKLSGNDIVVIIEPHNKEILNIEGCVYLGDLSEEFMNIPSLSRNILDSMSHCNFIVNQRIAKRIYKDIYETGALDKPRKQDRPEKIQNYYVPLNIREYFVDYFAQYELHGYEKNIKVGAAVMNCNPFTKGHRYLIEKALTKVDKLYVFVVEEDKSYFKFADRLKMVEMGVSDLANVRVVPSGKYILSKDTFSQYFEKEQVNEVESMDYDVHIFGEIVAAELGIKYRFVGEEPFDKVSREYNETMKRILPEHGVEVVEIPRREDEELGIISATSVRKALQKEEWEIISRFCPRSTYNYLKQGEL